MRRAAALTMVVLAAVLFGAAAIAWYADDTLVDDQEFATRLTSSLDDGEVRGVVGDQIVTGLTSSAVPDALIVRPLIVPLVAAVAEAPVFRRTVHGALASRHRALVRGDTAFSLQLPLGEGTLFEGLRRIAPRVASRIPADLRVPVLRLDPKGFALTAARRRCAGGAGRRRAGRRRARGAHPCRAGDRRWRPARGCDRGRPRRVRGRARRACRESRRGHRARRHRRGLGRAVWRPAQRRPDGGVGWRARGRDRVADAARRGPRRGVALAAPRRDLTGAPRPQRPR